VALAELRVGMRHEETLLVTERVTVSEVLERFEPGMDMPAVFGTAYLVGFVEWTCMRLLAPYLEPRQRSLGTRVDLSHRAATPVGMKVTAEVRLEGVDGRRLRFRVVCRDEAEVICEGDHERFVVEVERFLKGLEKKQDGLGAGG